MLSYFWVICKIGLGIFLVHCEKNKSTIPKFEKIGPTVGSGIPHKFTLNHQNINLGKIYSALDMILIELVRFCQELASLFDKSGLSIVNISLGNISLRKYRLSQSLAVSWSFIWNRCAINIFMDGSWDQTTKYCCFCNLFWYCEKHSKYWHSFISFCLIWPKLRL